MRVHPPQAAARFALITSMQALLWGDPQPSMLMPQESTIHRVPSDMDSNERWLMAKMWDVEEPTLTTIKSQRKMTEGSGKAKQVHPPPAVAGLRVTSGRNGRGWLIKRTQVVRGCLRKGGINTYTGLNELKIINPRPCTGTKTTSTVRSGIERVVDDIGGNVKGANPVAQVCWSTSVTPLSTSLQKRI